VAGLIVVAASAALGGDALYQALRTPNDGDPFDPRHLPPQEFWSEVVTGPPAVPAAQAGLADDEPVVGVVAGGKARAYRRDALKMIAYHVVNDVVGGVPVTVTHCDRTRCTRAFTTHGGRALRLRVAGYRDGLLLKLDGQTYRQEDGRPVAGSADGPVPFEPFPAAELTWREWRAAHPDTDVVVSPGPAAATHSGG
jgi:hypothetical protein